MAGPCVERALERQAHCAQESWALGAEPVTVQDAFLEIRRLLLEKQISVAIQVLDNVIKYATDEALLCNEEAWVTICKPILVADAQDAVQKRKASKKAFMEEPPEAAKKKVGWFRKTCRINGLLWTSSGGSRSSQVGTARARSISSRVACLLTGRHSQGQHQCKQPSLACRWSENPDVEKLSSLPVMQVDPPLFAPIGGISAPSICMQRPFALASTHRGCSPELRGSAEVAAWSTIVHGIPDEADSTVDLDGVTCQLTHSSAG
eukprot:TRINITY_DN51191_c0_g1_i1.p2 TRINITY_DN51191_c0_g1~~TRINITY_DN51191_c0_g1_i1.p2  ORF type:complete len:263 (+),score=35.31 TRINITY_DN51191_c0_g1_i1:77-865(+)